MTQLFSIKYFSENIRHHIEVAILNFEILLSDPENHQMNCKKKNIGIAILCRFTFPP